MPVVKTEKSLTDAIDRHRRRARELKADLHGITSAPYPASHAKARMREQVEVLAQRGAVNVSQLVEHNGDLEFPTQQTQVAILNAQPGAVGFVQVSDTLALLAWTFKDSLLARIDAEVMAEADDAPRCPLRSANGKKPSSRATCLTLNGRSLRWCGARRAKACRSSIAPMPVHLQCLASSL
jgi:hypothetical protein